MLRAEAGSPVRQSQEPEELLQLQEGVVTGPALIGSWGNDNSKHQLR